MRNTAAACAAALLLALPAAAQRKPAPRPAPKPAAPKVSAQYAPPGGLTAMPLSEKLELRDRPGGAVVATLDGGDTYQVDVRAAAREGVRIAVDGREGWVGWGDVVPSATAIVVDARSGAVVARVPLGAQADSVIYSPDRSKAVFFTSGGNEYAYEVSTADWTVGRAVRVKYPEGEGYSSIVGMFYGPRDGALRAVVSSSDVDGNTRMLVARVAEAGAAPPPPDLTSDASAYLPLPGGAAALLMHIPSDMDTMPTKAEVLDLATMKPRATLSIPKMAAYNTTVSDDGSTLYVVDDTTVGVYDAATGAKTGTIGSVFGPGESITVMRSNVAGSAMLAHTYTDKGKRKTMWVGAGAPAPADRRVVWVTRSGEEAVGADSVGAAVFRLDARRGVASAAAVERPEVRPGWLEGWQPAHMMALLPGDAPGRVILVVGVPEGD